MKEPEVFKQFLLSVHKCNRQKKWKQSKNNGSVFSIYKLYDFGELKFLEPQFASL